MQYNVYDIGGFMQKIKQQFHNSHIEFSDYVYNMVIIDDDSGDDDGGHQSVVGPVHLRRAVNDPLDLMGSNKWKKKQEQVCEWNWREVVAGWLISLDI